MDGKKYSGQTKSRSESDFLGFPRDRIDPSNAVEDVQDGKSKRGNTANKAGTSVGKQTTSSKARKILELKLEAAKKLEKLEEEMLLRKKEMIELELQLQISQVASQSDLDSIQLEDIEEAEEECYPVGKNVDQKVNHWLFNNDFKEYSFRASQPNELNVESRKTDIIEDEERRLGSRMENILVRNTMKTDLPLFSGDPEDWTLFYSQFKKSTEICKFSDEENLVRLQKCLRGRARDSVKPLLISSRNIDEIIDSLEMSFGRPQMIISMLIDKVRKAHSPRDGRPDTMIAFTNLVINLTTTIETLNAKGYLSNPELLEEITRKLPYFLKMDWGSYFFKNRNADLKNFSGWLKEKAKIMSLIDVPNFKQEDTRIIYKKKEAVMSVRERTDLTRSCFLCKKDFHSLENCAEFKKEDIEERWKIVVQNKACFCCLGKNHSKNICRKKKQCGIGNCMAFHNQLLHKDKENDQNLADSSGREMSVPESVLTVNEQSNNVFLKVVPVNLRGPNKEISTYAFFDEGASISLIDAELAEILELPGKSAPVCYQWTNNITHQDLQSRKVSLEISGTSSGARTFELQGVRTIKDMMLPKQTLEVEKIKRLFPQVEQLDMVESYHEIRPMLLIGQDYGQLTVSKKSVELSMNGPILSKTALGWVIHGKLVHQIPNNNKHFVYHLCNVDEHEIDLHELVKSSFSTESFGVKIVENVCKKEEEIRCEKIMSQTLKRLGNRFEIGLLWKHDKVEFPDSKNNALRRLFCMEKKMDRNKEFAEQYCLKIEDYVEKGYAKKLSSEEIQSISEKIWYLPHFGVINVNKPGKLRLVFNAAEKTEGVSMNTELLQGPDLLTSLVGVLLKFRRYRIAYTGDIKEMFHQVRIRAEDRPAQRFFWRGMRRNGNPDVYEMQAMIFGATCSPCIAQYVKNSNAAEYKHEFPEVYDAILNKHYVDDYLDSKVNEAEAIQCIKDVIQVHKYGGFEICGFISNSEEVLQSIPVNLRSQKNKNLDEHNSVAVERVLGLQWVPKDDVFIFPLKLQKINPKILDGSKYPTKREVLKMISSVFDPLGMLCNVLITGKILLQEIWRTGIGWDDEISAEMNELWNNWLNNIRREIPLMTIPRCYGARLAESSNIELHGFCDASEKAFSAVIYLRFVMNNEFEVSFVMAKSRVAPLKSMTIPRLELQAAVMVSRLMNTVVSEIDLEISKKYYWTDSKTVLHWIRRENVTYKMFIAQRVGEVLDLTKKEEWYWICTKENIADDATRSLKGDNLCSRRWFSGPEFLKSKFDEKLDENMDINDVDEINLEIKRTVLTISLNRHNHGLPDVNRFSKYEKLVRTTAWILRFLGNCKRNRTKNQGYLTVEEIEKAEMLWYKQVQSDSYDLELRDLETVEKLKKIVRYITYLQL